jgi:hypothetical protein
VNHKKKGEKGERDNNKKGRKEGGKGDKRECLYENFLFP